MIIKVNNVKEPGKTILFDAVKDGNLQIVQCLVEHGADVNAKNDDGMSVLQYAVNCGKQDVAQWLKEHNEKESKQ